VPERRKLPQPETAARGYTDAEKKCHPTPEAAYAALSAACVIYGRTAAKLPALPVKSPAE
jgi:hypothetical protein